MSAPQGAAFAGLFTEVTDKKLLQTVALIDRLPQRGAVDGLLAPLRPRLQRLKPPRPLTLRRVLTFPLEELLVPASAWRPGTSRLSRDLLAVIHKMVLTGLAPERLAAIDQAVAGHTMHDKPVLFRAGKALWPEAVAILRAAAPAGSAGGDGKGRNQRQQLALAADLLDIGEPLALVFLGLPEKPVRRLDEGQKQRIGTVLKNLEVMGRHALVLGSEALGQRLGDPSVLLEVLQSAGDSGLSAIRQAAAREASRRVMAELDGVAEHLHRGVRQPAGALAETLVQLVGTVSALETAPADLPVDRAQLKLVARKAAKAVEGHLQAVVFGEVLEGFKLLAAPEIDDDTIAGVEAAARAARKLGAAGRQLGVGGQVDRLVKAAFDDFRRALAAPDGNPLGVAPLMDQLRIVEIVFGAEAASALLAETRR